MKKIEYKAPEMEVVNLKVQQALLITSDGAGSTTDPNNPISGGSGEVED